MHPDRERIAPVNNDTCCTDLKTHIDPLKWCRYLVHVGYITSSLMVLAHIIWYFAARSVLAWSPDIYLRDYIILPAIGFFILDLSVDLAVRSPRISLFWKEYLALSLFVIFSSYLSLTHDIARVLLGSFLLPIFVSTIFSNIKITRMIFWLSDFALLLLGATKYFAGTLNSDLMMQIFVAFFMFLCAFLLSRILILYGTDNQTALMNSNKQRRDMQEQLKLDPFTGLFNRKTFDADLAKLIDECQNTGKCLSLAMIDIDYFKSVNDLYGHVVGDQVLLHLAKILAAAQAENIKGYRIGGEEFAILFVDCDTEETYRICEGLRKLMESASLQDINNTKVTFSCGFICRIPNNSSSKFFLTSADSALYRAKNNGRNQVVIYNDSIKNT